MFKEMYSFFTFKEFSEYLEDLAVLIVFLLDTIDITFLHQLIFDIPQLTQFKRSTGAQ